MCRNGVERDGRLQKPKAMTSKWIFLTGFAITISCAPKNAIETQSNFLTESGLLIEKITGNDSNRYTTDNKIFTIGRELIYSYYIVREGDTLMVTAPRMISLTDNFQKCWDFVAKEKDDEDKIELITITVLNGISNENQTQARYDYRYQLGFTSFYSTSGIVENTMNVWMHPHREKYFSILELNPFPYAKQPYRVGSKWTWELEIGDHWQDERWKTWSGVITNKYKYEIIELRRETLPIGELDCWVIFGIAESEIGTTKLISFFNEEKGFVKLDFTNIDGSRLLLELREIK